ncbi:MAG: sulfatase-like hydrolase/transferase [Caulobacteraceae bacterium]|jgi:arylsulfatase A-like enzyme
MTTTRDRPPNFIVVLCDDLGYGDVSIHGPSLIHTPAVERMAREGVVLTDYYAPANLCTPSRAGLLTGRYPVRTGLGFEVIMQQDDRGLPLSEVTIAQALKPDYATGLFGKWHLGHRGECWPPTRHGFDVFFGLPYSHDMQPLSLYEAEAGRDRVDELPVDFPGLQQAFFNHAQSFIEAHRDRPFFVELALSAPHLPSYPNPPHDVTAPAGPYGAVVREIDDILGRLLDQIRRLGLAEDTVLIFTSDNGPWFEGSPGWLRERKGGAAYDGGYRVPCVAWGPGRLPAGLRTDSICMGIDLLPTFLSLAGRPPLADVTLDGRDICEVLIHGAPSRHEALILFDNETPVGVRTQGWKYLISAYYRGLKLPLSSWGEQLFDMKADPSENYSVAAVHPEMLATMKAHMERAKTEFAPFRHAEMPPVFKRMRDYVLHMQD